MFLNKECRKVGLLLTTCYVLPLPRLLALLEQVLSSLQEPA
jgi:hypothetical protein